MDERLGYMDDDYDEIVSRDNALSESASRPVEVPIPIVIGQRCPGCAVVCNSFDTEHLDNCPFIGRLKLLYCSAGCTGPWHQPDCLLAGRTRY